TSLTLLWSADDRLLAFEANTSALPARANDACHELAFPARPLWLAEARKVSPLKPLSCPLARRIFTYTCCVPAGAALVTEVFQFRYFVLRSARLVASETKATRSQSPSMATS